MPGEMKEITVDYLGKSMTVEVEPALFEDLAKLGVDAEAALRTVLEHEIREAEGRFDIGTAVAFMREGCRVRRVGWNGKGMHLELQVPDEHSKMSLPYVFMFTACGNRVPWLCSQTDLLAVDWELAD